MLKKTTDTLKMTSNDRHIVTRTDFMTGLTRLDQQCNRTKTQTTEKKEKKKKPPLRIFENFCQHTLHTFAKPHKPTHSPSFAKECNFANTPTNNNNI